MIHSFVITPALLLSFLNKRKIVIELLKPVENPVNRFYEKKKLGNRFRFELVRICLPYFKGIHAGRIATEHNYHNYFNYDNKSYISIFNVGTLLIIISHYTIHIRHLSDLFRKCQSILYVTNLIF